MRVPQRGCDDCDDWRCEVPGGSPASPPGPFDSACVDLVHVPVLSGAVAGCTRFGGGSAEDGGVEVCVRGGVDVVVAAEAGDGGGALRGEVVAQCGNRCDSRRERERVCAGDVALLT